MIYIFSSPKDYSTSNVIEWLTYFEKKHKRINDLLHTNIEVSFKISNNATPKSALMYNDSIWYRKMGTLGIPNEPAISNYYKLETITLTKHLESLCESKNIIGSFYHEISKLEILYKVLNHGIRIPETVVTNSKRQLKEFYKKSGKVIMKPISDAITIDRNNKHLGTYTTLVKKELIKTLPDRFATTLFQQYIEKEFELRIFYLKGRLYPMAIFSQNNDRTRVDFRKYDWKRPSRYVPYMLPKQLEKKLVIFLKECKYEASSVDMVKCRKTGEYYFLEVNPWGQFGMISKPCNYYLEKKIAEAL